MIVAAAFAACSVPAQRVADSAHAYGFQRRLLPGAGFEHVVYSNSKRAAGGVLHVYIEGDGTPYLNRWSVAADPTPRHPLMLQLMSLDPGPAVYIGRPCYFGLAQQPPCSPLDWTTGRYSERVVDSMARVIGILVSEGGFARVEIFGHSGGGTLAVLLARRTGEVSRLVTLAGNLDPVAWAALHRYAPLQDSLDPLAGGALPAQIEQLHLAGKQDKNIPPRMTRDAVVRLGTGQLLVLPGVDHTCCWEDIWPAVLAGQIPSPL